MSTRGKSKGNCRELLSAEWELCSSCCDSKHCTDLFTSDVMQYITVVISDKYSIYSCLKSVCCAVQAVLSSQWVMLCYYSISTPQLLSHHCMALQFSCNNCTAIIPVITTISEHYALQKSPVALLHRWL